MPASLASGLAAAVDLAVSIQVMNKTEVLAQHIVEAVLQGSRMVYRPDQSSAVPDFDLHHSDGLVAALEVTASEDRSAIETYAAIGSRRKGGPRVRARFSKKSWRIYPVAGANINLIRAEVDRHLAELESAGVEHFFSATHRRDNKAIEAIYVDLKVAGGDVVEGLEPGVITIAHPITGGVIGGSLVTEAVEREALKADNRCKLARAGAAETHLFVFVDLLHAEVWTPLVHFPPPSIGPVLPPEITHVWVAGPAGSQDGYVVWRADQGSGWQSMGVVTVQRNQESSLQRA